MLKGHVKENARHVYGSCMIMLVGQAKTSDTYPVSGHLLNACMHVAVHS